MTELERLLPWPAHLTDRIVVVTRQFIRFSGAGAVGTCAHYAILLIGVALGADPVWASGLGATVGAAINYALNHRLVFRSTAAHWQSGPRFAVIAVSSLILNTALMAVGTKLLGLQYLLAQIAVTALVLVWNFTLSRVWAFQQDRHVA